MSPLIKEFNDYRSKMNEVILSKDNLVMKRLWNLDTNTYAEGALDVKTKELLYEVSAVANIVGGTIVIPHTRRAAEYWEELEKDAEQQNG